MPLKYLFRAVFSDGSTIEQTQDDVSTTDKTKSAWFDVLNRIGDVRTFLLVSDSSTVSINITPGQKLVYEREVTQRLHITKDGQTKSTTVVYCVGWESVVDGESIRQVVRVD